MTEILVLYYSRNGSTADLASQVCRGINAVADASARLRTVPPVSPDTRATLDDVPSSGPPYASLQDLADCDGLILGSPVRFGNMAAALKYFLDGTSSEWLSGQLRGKPGGLFVSGGSLHGGQESTLLSMALPLLHHGMVLVGVPFSEPALNATTTGGTPYGASRVTHGQTDVALSSEETAVARHLGRRVAEAAIRLRGWDRP